VLHRVVRHTARHAKVANLEVARRREQQIARLDVTMQHLCVCRNGERCIGSSDRRINEMNTRVRANPTLHEAVHNTVTRNANANASRSTQ
jgi:hypothetical protein